MKTSKLAVGIALALGALTAAQSAIARPGHHASVGIGFGVPIGYGAYHHYWGGPYYHHPYYYPPAYYPAPVVVQQQPITYIEQAPAPAVQSPAQPQGYWYYCADSRAYYPYVKDCPAGWQRVSPKPN